MDEQAYFNRVNANYAEMTDIAKVTTPLHLQAIAMLATIAKTLIKWRTQKTLPKESSAKKALTGH